MNSYRMKTQDLIGPALDWAVAKCMWPDDIGNTVPFHRDGSDYSPSTNWAHGGPLIEREEIAVIKDGAGWTALKTMTVNHPHLRVWAKTPLVAAMRCYVASVLGDSIEVPEELK